MHQASLFRRLGASPRYLSTPSRAQQVFEHVSAIKAHLDLLLNSRQGCSQSSPELGLSDFNSHLGGMDLMSGIAADIRRTLEAYEPRLEVLALHSCANPDQPNELAFRIECQVRVDRLAEQVQINLTVDHRRTHVK